MCAPGQHVPALVTLLLLSGGAYGQDTGEPDSQEVDEIVVTGSRIPRNTYTSIAPLQIIAAEDQREIGQIDAATVLQESIAATGLQTERSQWVGWILPGGPGSANVSLRGLGAARTLVLINGRRIGPAGVEGAPSEVDLNVVPSSLVGQYDLLLDGASSIYGSDAVAGVANLILRRDFDGFEAEVYATVPEQSGGNETSINIAWGKNFRQGFIGIGAEYQDNEAVTYGQRRWTRGCTRNVEVDQLGRIRHDGHLRSLTYGTPVTECQLDRFGGNIWLDDFRSYTGGIDEGPGAIYYTPGRSNTGIPGWSETHTFMGGVDGDGDGELDANVFDYSLDHRIDRASLYSEFDRQTTMAYGEYTLAGELALTPFFEAQFARRRHRSDAGTYPFWVPVPPQNPYNPCNPDGIDGIDCIVARNEFWSQPGIIDQFTDWFGVPPSAFGLDANQPVGGIWVAPRPSIRGDRNIQTAEVSQLRGVVGVRGDLPMLKSEHRDDWQFEVALVISDSTGSSSRAGIRYDWLEESLATSMVDPDSGDVVCGADTSGDGFPDGFLGNGRPCVPVNLFAPSLYSPVYGDFASQAERDFLFDTRDFETDYRQWLGTAAIGGDLWQWPAGPVGAIFGVEYRKDRIRSIPDAVARDGLFYAFKTDGGAIGERSVREAFAEFEFPLFSDLPGAQELSLNLSGRYTNDEYYDSHTTYSAKLGWRPVNSLLLRATTGTSFRAPNLRENFFIGVTGYYPFFDPCVIPEDVYDPLGGYDPSRDTREPHVLENCRRDGVDPETFDRAGQANYMMQYTQGGTTELHAETSDAWSLGFVWDPPLSGTSALRIGATYYDIKIEDTIIWPWGDYVIDECYGDVDLNSTLCGRIERDPDSGEITFVSLDFINRDEAVVSGYDFNISYSRETQAFGQPLDLDLEIVANHPTQASQTYGASKGEYDVENLVGFWGYPDWHGTATLTLGLQNYRFNWHTRYIGSVHLSPAGRDPWSDINEGGSDTCFGPTQYDVQCRDVGFADDYTTHTVSLFYHSDRWTIGGGVRNLLDRAPPMVDDSEVPRASRNVPLGWGYDLNGRTYFFNLQARFE